MPEIIHFSQKAAALLKRRAPVDVLYEEKLAAARRRLEGLCYKFPQSVDVVVFKELDRLAACLQEHFIQLRAADYLAKLAYSMYFARRKLLSLIELFPWKEFSHVCVMPCSLEFTFGSKHVVGILAHVSLKNRYESFDEERILFLAQKVMPDLRLLKGSVYTFQASGDAVKTVYFEVNKMSGDLFTPEEVKRLKAFLKRNMRCAIERLVPRVFIALNEEVILKNLLLLSREIRCSSTVPQVMITLNQQASEEVVFTVILVRIHQADAPTLQKCFEGIAPGLEYAHDRHTIVRYLKKKYPIEANVFRIKVAKDAALLRADLSLDFYLARQKVSQAVEQAVGTFRDYDGGLIIKQREVLAAFKNAFPEVSLTAADLLENFYDSLSPIEIQATISIDQLKVLFELFLEGVSGDLIPPNYFLKYTRDEQRLFLMVCLAENSFKETVEKILSSKNLQPVVTSTLTVQNTLCLGYLLETTPLLQKQVVQEISQAIREWQQKIAKQQILRLALEFPVVSLDPRKGGDQISSLILKMLFEGLMRLNRDGKIENGLAETVDISPDQKNYLFKLRPSCWSNEDPVSAFDFEYAWKKVLSPAFKTPFAYLFYPIKNAKLAKHGAVPPDAIGVNALDHKTLHVELEFIAPYFLELTAQVVYSPVNRVVDQRHPNWPSEENEGYICNGAFQLTKNQPNEGYALIKNPRYWDHQNIRLEGALVSRVSHQQAYALFQSNMTHWVGPPLEARNMGFKPADTDEPIAISKGTVYWCVFNNRQFPFHNKKIRKALALAINRSEIAADGGLSPAISPLPPLHSQVDASALCTCDPTLAQSLFKEALEELKLSHQDFPPITLMYLAGAIGNSVTELIKRQWETTFNIRCTLEPLSWNTVCLNLTEGNFQVGGMGWEAWINDPIYTLNVFREASDPMNHAKWEYSPYQRALDNADKEVDLERRKHYYLQAEEILLDEVPVTAVYSVYSKAVKKKNLNVHSSSALMNFKWAHLTEPS